jgi:uncharacterized membrane protein
MSIELIEQYFLLFLMYSFLGWLAETIAYYLESKKLINRGFLLGPVCPIYGMGALLITIILTKYSDDYFVLFGLSAIMCGSLEYFTSYLMEKLFNARWWDYTDKKYNINGRVCLDYIILFGIGGVLIVTLINPFIEPLLEDLISKNHGNILSIIFGIIILVDFIISLNVMNKIKDITKSVKGQVKDNTEEITRKIRETISEKSMLYKRIISAFPQAFASKIKEGAQKVKYAAVYVKTKTIKTINEAKIRTIENVKIVKEKTAQRVQDIRTNINQEKSNNMRRKAKIRRILKSIQGAKIRVIFK